MPQPADYLTIDVFNHAPRGPRAWSRSVKSALKQPIAGLRSVTVNHSNHATHTLSPRTVVQPGRALIAAWDSPEAALAAFRGPLAKAVHGPGRFSLDGEVAEYVWSNPTTTGTGGTRQPKDATPCRRTNRWWSSYMPSSSPHLRGS